MKKKLLATGKLFKNSNGKYYNAMIRVPKEYVLTNNLTPGKTRLEFYMLDNKYLLLKPLEEIEDAEFDDLSFEKDTNSK